MALANRAIWPPIDFGSSGKDDTSSSTLQALDINN